MYCSSHGSCGYYMEYCSRTLIYSSTSFNHQLALQSSLAGHHFSSTKYRCSWTNKYLLSASEKNPSSVLDLFQLMCGLAMDGLSKPSVFKSADHVDIQNKIAHVRLFNTSTKKSVGTFSNVRDAAYRCDFCEILGDHSEFRDFEERILVISFISLEWDFQNFPIRNASVNAVDVSEIPNNLPYPTTL